MSPCLAKHSGSWISISFRFVAGGKWLTAPEVFLVTTSGDAALTFLASRADETCAIFAFACSEPSKRVLDDRVIRSRGNSDGCEPAGPGRAAAVSDTAEVGELPWPLPLVPASKPAFLGLAASTSFGLLERVVCATRPDDLARRRPKLLRRSRNQTLGGAGSSTAPCESGGVEARGFLLLLLQLLLLEDGGSSDTDEVGVRGVIGVLSTGEAIVRASAPPFLVVGRDDDDRLEGVRESAGSGNTASSGIRRLRSG